MIAFTAFGKASGRRPPIRSFRLASNGYRVGTVKLKTCHCSVENASLDNWRNRSNSMDNYSTTSAER